MTAFFRSARVAAALFVTTASFSFALPAAALDTPKPSLSKSTEIVTVKDVRTKHRRNRDHHYRGDVVRAPFTRVEKGRRHTTVDAPFARVHNGRHGQHIVAPFVDLWIPR